MKGRAFALLVLLGCSGSHAVRAQVPVSATPEAGAPDTVTTVPPAPPVFAHDLFLLQMASRFSVARVDVNVRFPGPLGVTEDRLAEHLPGVGFRRNGVPSQAGEYSWFGGDGEALGFQSDWTEWNFESLGFPYYGGSDPVLFPPLGDSLFVLAAPLLTDRPGEVVSWRQPTLPDSLQAIALHANGPDGFSHTGGRFRGPIGGGYEFDGQFYRDFSDGNLSAAASDAHTLDFELRRRISGWPTRLRFRQARGERQLAYRWDDTGLRATHRYLLTDVGLAAAHQDDEGEWLYSIGLQHEDQKLRDPTSSTRTEWFGRKLTATLSRLLQGTWTRRLALDAAWRLKDESRGIPAVRNLRLQGEVLRSYSTVDLALTGAVGTESDQNVLWRLAAAAAWRPKPDQRITLSAGRSLAAPPLLRRLTPFDVRASGDPDLGGITHESASAAWSVTMHPLQLEMMAAAGRSIDLPVWQPQGDESTPYAPKLLERHYSGASITVTLHVLRGLVATGGVDHLFQNEYVSAGAPVYAPDDSWFAELRGHAAVPGSRVELGPVVSVRGARGGTLIQDYYTYSAGIDARVRQLLIFWRVENLDDYEFRTGGTAHDYGRYYRYGFRWEFWN